MNWEKYILVYIGIVGHKNFSHIGREKEKIKFVSTLYLYKYKRNKIFKWQIIYNLPTELVQNK